MAECIDPDGTQARDENKLLERDKTAHHKRGLTLSPDKDGAGRYVRGYLNTEGAAVIAAALDGLSAPIPDTAAGEQDSRSPAQRRHDALTELCRRQLQTGQLPATGGIKTRIIITIPLSSLQNRAGAGRLNDGYRSPPAWPPTWAATPRSSPPSSTRPAP